MVTRPPRQEILGKGKESAPVRVPQLSELKTAVPAKPDIGTLAVQKKLNPERVQSMMKARVDVGQKSWEGQSHLAHAVSAESPYHAHA